MIDAFSFTPFFLKVDFFDNAGTSIADVPHIVMALLWHLMTSFSDVSLIDGVHASFTPNEYQTRQNSRFYLTLGRITLLVPGLNQGFL